MKKINILWFKRDLRIKDNEALNESIKDYDVLPLYIIERKLWSQKAYSDRQWQFCKESLLDLREALSNIGQPLIIRTGNVVEILDEISNKFDIKGIYSHQETGDLYTYKRDKEVRKWANKKNIIWKEYLQFAVFRGELDRDKWSKKWKAHMKKKISTHSLSLKYIPFDIGLIPPDKSFCFEKDLCYGRLKGGRKKGLERMNIFLKNKLNSYAKNISSPEKSFDSCSRLSPYLSWGCISLREIYSQVELSKNINSKMFKSRLTWHCHFIQKLECEPELQIKELHPYFQNIRKSNNKLLELWSEGKTGFPFVDACMRSLNFNGWINFRMRAMLMSFASYNLWIPWQESGLKLASKFIDYEPGIHWNQCQMQSGTTSINAYRIYNPIKQGKDHDPNGSFIRKWIPELNIVPDSFIHEPWLFEIFNQGKFNYKNNYIKPIVNITKTTKEARKKIKEIIYLDGYRDISKKIYSKHGSRKKNFNKRKSYSNKNVVLEPHLANQMQLKL